MQIFPNPFPFLLPPLLQVKFNKALADYSIAQSPRLIDGIVLTKFDTIDDKVNVGSFELLACDMFWLGLEGILDQLGSL